MKVKILSEEIEIKFNMAVEIGYEEIIGEAFDVTQLDKQKNSLALYMSAILANNPGTAITMDRLLTEATGHEIAQLSKAVVEAMTTWMEVPAVTANEKKEEGDTEKNA